MFSRRALFAFALTTSLVGCNCSTEQPPPDGGTQCTSAATCPATGSECLEPACVNGQCTTRPAMAGLLVAAQTAGDCQVNQCDGVGNVVSIVDATDVPDDLDPCTVDSCVAGAPSHLIADAGSACGADGGLLCNAAGECVGCLTGADCSGQDTDCRTRVCNAGTCDVAFTPEGTPTSNQTPGDCSENQCNATGDVMVVALATDVPDDSNPCTDDLCTGTTPSNVPTSAGTTCADGGIVCDGAGACVACNQASDCPGQDSFCRVRSCVNHACGFADTASGTALPTQTAGDCRRVVCDGAGGTSNAVDDTDLPVDMNPCTSDVCTAGTPTNPLLAAGTACGTNLVCSATGACVGCVTAADCGGTSSECGTVICTNNTCGVSFAAAGTAITAQTAGDCQLAVCDGSGNVTSAPDNADVPVDNVECTQDVCTAGVPSNPPVAIDTACTQGGGSRCDGAGVCVACTTAAHCPATTECATYACTAGACVPTFAPSGTPVTGQTAGDCQRAVCDGAGATTSAVDDTDVPVDGNACTLDVCTAGTPSNPLRPAGTVCGTNQVCTATGACVGCLTAADCPGTSSECGTVTCTNNTCGVSFAPAGTALTSQTAGDCQVLLCDGAGSVTSNADNADLPVDNLQCTDDVCTAGVPSNPPVAIDTPCTQGGGLRCDGAGACVTCTSVSQCPATTDCVSYACTAGACVPSFMAAGTVTSAQTAGDCRENQCDGAGAIVSAIADTDVPVDGQECTLDVCTAGVPTNPARAAGASCSQGGGTFCDGAGACVQCTQASECGASTDCVTYSCTSGVCGTSFAPAGTPLSTQTAGDCQQAVCNSSGGVVSQSDDTDVPVDGNQCTNDVCSIGMPSNPNVPAGTTCSQSGGSLCNGTGSCVQCLVAADCASGVCVSNVCQAPTCTDLVKNGAETDVDCGGGTCPACAPTKACLTGSDCQTANCASFVCASPSVVSITPADLSTNVPTSATIAITFSGAMTAGTLTAQPGTGTCTNSLQVSLDNFVTCIGITGPVAVAGATATLTPAVPLAAGTRYRVRVTSAAQDSFGNAVTPFTQLSGFSTVAPASSACGVVISQVYGGGGNVGAPLTHDFVELRNLGTAPVSLNGWSIQYGGATSTATWVRVNLPAATIAPGAYFLIQLGTNGAVGTPLPTPDFASGSINLAAASGKVALVSDAVALSGACPGGPTVVDLVGYGTANCSETAPTPILSNILSAARVGFACADTNSNVADFRIGAPNPRNSTTVGSSCTWCGLQNELNTPLEADYANLQFPTTISAPPSTTTPMIYGRIYEAGTTEAAGGAMNVVAQVGYAPAGVDPRTQCGWQFFPASFNIQMGNDDEYQGQFTAPAVPGTYWYTFRFSLDSGATWTYGDLDGAGSNAGLTFDTAQLGVLTVP